MLPEPFRPAYHFSPARNWMNDPNGLVWYDGEYHLFFQHNPHGSDWGNMSWGHAVSRDLLHWQELDVALRATEDEQVFSGSVVVDHANTSGVGRDGVVPMVAVYTGHRPGGDRQVQCVAWSLDRGRTWTRHDDNPVLDVGSSDFRDPKVFWYAPDRCWVMVVALSVARVVSLYRSPDLLRWEHLSDVGPFGAVADVWECPDLFEVPVDRDPGRTRWVLVVSVQGGAPAGGSGMQYAVGDFDGRTFTPDGPSSAPDGGPSWVDFGADHYAAVSFGDTPDGRRVLIGWMSNWDYAAAIPTAGFRGSMSAPRSYELRHLDGRLRLVQRPVLPGIPEPSYDRRAVDVRAGVHALPPEAAGTALVVVAEVEPGTASRCGLQVRVGDGERTVVGYDAVAEEVYLDRTCSGVTSFHPAFSAVHRAPLAPRDGMVRLEVLVDAASVEVFAGVGEATISDQVFPAAQSSGVAVFAEGGTMHLRRLTVTPVAGTRDETPRQDASASTAAICDSADDARSGRLSR